MRFFRRSLIALGVAAILPTAVFAAVVLFYFLQAEGRRLEAETLQQSKTIMALIDARLDSDVAALRVLSSSPLIETQDWVALHPRIGRALDANPHWATVVMFDAATRRQIFDARRPLGELSSNRLSDSIDWNGLAGSAVAIGDITQAGDTAEHLVYVQMPVRNGTRLVYVLAAAIRPQEFQGILTAHVAPGTTAALVDHQGRFVARTLNYEERIGKPATQYVRRAIQEQQQGFYRGTTYEGLKNYTAFYASPWSRWSVHIAIASALIDEPTSWSFLVAGLAGLGCVLLGGVLVVLVLRDMADRRRAEETLRQSQKMEAVGQLTGGIAHDFNNLLTAIMGNLDLIRSRGAGNERLQRLADHALEAARRGAKLTAQLLAFSRHQRMSLAPVELTELLDGMSVLLTQSVGPSIQVITDISSDANVVLSDANQLELALLNLCVNARDAMPSGGTLCISSCRASEQDLRHLAKRPYVEIRVSDTGIGMNEEIRGRAMEPFFTTKPVGQGTGLGLSQVYGIVRESGGTVLIDSDVSQGTTVRLILPAGIVKRAAPEIEHSSSPTVPGARPGSQKIILVVDDDNQVRRFIVESLRGLGYQVHAAATGQAGLTILNEVPVDLLLVDFAMPGMNGAEVARSALTKRPDLPVLMVSGYADSAAVEAVAGTAKLLRKPFDFAELGAAVAELLKRG